jgi:hypothetical protein
MGNKELPSESYLSIAAENFRKVLLLLRWSPLKKWTPSFCCKGVILLNYHVVRQRMQCLVEYKILDFYYRFERNVDFAISP